jgi:5-hydroxyisourate hydrolase
MSISTHVLDTSIGRPARGVAVRLQRCDGAVLVDLAQAATDDDGRVAALTGSAPALAGRYRLTFDAGSYFRGRGIDSFYREIPIEFTIPDGAGHVHVPLLLSPYGYSTYRGS